MKPSRLALACGACLAFFAQDIVYAGTKLPLKLKVESPAPPKNAGDDDDDEGVVLPLEFRSGWSLRFRLKPKRDFFFAMKGFAGGGDTGPYPESGEISWLVFEDLDGCLYLGGVFEPGLGFPPCDDVPGDETFLEFTPDVDFVDLVDEIGRADLRDALADPAGFVNFSRDGFDFTLGPRVTTTADGIGYGANDDLPGFVIVSDTGVGRVQNGDLDSAGTGPGFDRVDPAVARNLAGLIHSVSYELSDVKFDTTVTASLHVPRALFGPLRIIDQCYLGESGLPGCPGGFVAMRVDGGPIVPDDFAPSPDPDSGTSDVADVTLHAFVVQGDAPALLPDCNGDGTVDSGDATCLGYRLISNEVVVRFRQMGNHISVCHVVGDAWGNGNFAGVTFADFDGNGGGVTINCPSGGGSTSDPSR